MTKTSLKAIDRAHERADGYQKRARMLRAAATRIMVLDEAKRIVQDVMVDSPLCRKVTRAIERRMAEVARYASLIRQGD